MNHRRSIICDWKDPDRWLYLGLIMMFWPHLVIPAVLILMIPFTADLIALIVQSVAQVASLIERRYLEDWDKPVQEVTWR